MQYDFFGHVMPLVWVVASLDANGKKMALFHSFHQDNQIEMQPDFGHLMPLTLASLSHNANSHH